MVITLSSWGVYTEVDLEIVLNCLKFSNWVRIRIWYLEWGWNERCEIWKIRMEFYKRFGYLRFSPRFSDTKTDPSSHQILCYIYRNIEMFEICRKSHFVRPIKIKVGKYTMNWADIVNIPPWFVKFAQNWTILSLSIRYIIVCKNVDLSWGMYRKQCTDII